MRPEDRPTTPGDGKIGGVGTINGGRPVMVGGDDITVKRGSTAEVGSRRIARLVDLAVRKGMPFVYFGQTGGARIPDIMGSEGFAELPSMTEFSGRAHEIPLATAIVGPSFGASSFISAMSDFTVQVRGTCLAVTSPRVVAMATGEQVEADELGGADVHLHRTGQIDLAVDTPDEAYAAIRRFLSYLPPNIWTLPERAPARAAARRPSRPTPRSARSCPSKRTRAYDARRLVAKLVDEGSAFELRPGMGRGLYTCFARIDGWPVAVLASNPMFSAGVLDPAACEKGIRMLVLCDAFQIPAVFLQDVPGFLVGRQVEHGRVLYRAIRFLEALFACSAPTLTVVVRKAFGLAWQSMNGRRRHGRRALRLARRRDRLHGPRGRRQRALRRADVDGGQAGPGGRAARGDLRLRRGRRHEPRRDHRPRHHPPGPRPRPRPAGVPPGEQDQPSRRAT